ncbi:MAG: ABC transporter ATP-binding protein [Elusimicrobia bacterium]|nr:ABC transporter ATP-binding protein [Elusimicrobiota bacterium]
MATKGNKAATSLGALLEIRGLSVEYRRHRQVIPAVRRVSLTIRPGETVGVVGESGCGKSTLALAVLRLIQETEGRIREGEIVFAGRSLLTSSEEELRQIRGKEISIIFQDPFSSLNPVLPVGDQVEEVLLEHTGQRNPHRVLEIFAKVQLPDPQRIYHAYPHQLSGGQRQRVMIAMAIITGPQLLIADEPTTALDVTIQREILELLFGLQRELKMAILLISHHVGIIAQYTQRVAVMYAGEIVEEGETDRVLQNPQHPYTRGLLDSLPRLRGEHLRRLPMIPGQPPEPLHLPTGCPFHPRCPVAVARCQTDPPYLAEVQGRQVSCWVAQGGEVRS